jgi:predicted dehydrogenase
MMAIRVGIVGAGYIGEIHSKAVNHQPNAELAAVVDVDEDKARSFAEKHSIPKIYSSLEELIKNNQVDAIVIGTPNYLHAPQSIAALQAGLHVFVEKPMALSVEEAIRMDRASQDTSRTLMIGHCWRYDAEVNWLRAQVAAKTLGDIIRTKGYGIHENWGPAGWFTEKKLSGGGALMDMGIHAIDTARYLLGDPEPVSVYAQIGTYYGDYDVDDTGVLIITWKDGTVSDIESGWWQPYSDGPEAATRLFGVKGYGSIFPSRLVLPVAGTDRTEVIENGFVFPRQEHCEQAMYDRQMSHFLSCITEHATPDSSPAKGVSNMRILAAAYKSAETGTVVRLEEARN